MHPAIRNALENAGVAFREVLHSRLGVPVQSPADVAQALRIPVEQIAKTLLLHADKLCFAVLSSNRRLNFAAVSQAMGARCQVASKEALESAVGYPPGSLSPLGTTGFRVFIDSELQSFATILVGGGERGSEIELSRVDFIRLTNAQELRLS